MNLRKLLDKGFIVFDDAMGAMLHQAGLAGEKQPEIYNMTNPEVVLDIHRQYIKPVQIL